MLSQLVDDDTELISLYYGQDVLEEDAERFAGEIEEIYPDVDVDFQLRRTADLLLRIICRIGSCFIYDENLKESAS